MKADYIEGKGFIINELTEGSCAEKMRLKKGQLITHLNGEDITNTKKEDLLELVNKFRAAGLANNGKFSITADGQKFKGNRSVANNLICGDKAFSGKILELNLNKIVISDTKIVGSLSLTPLITQDLNYRSKGNLL